MIFKIANIKEDYKILMQASKDSLDFLNNTPVENLKLRDLFKYFFKIKEISYKSSVVVVNLWHVKLFAKFLKFDSG